MSLSDYLQMMREHFAAYHNQKEQLVFGAIGFLLAGLAAILAQPQPYWGKGLLEKIISIAVISVLGVAILLLVLGQLRARRYAANMTRAIDITIHDLLSGKTTETALQKDTATYTDKWWRVPTSRDMPAFLKSRMIDINKDGSWTRGMVLMELLSVGIVLFIIGIALAIIFV